MTALIVIGMVMCIWYWAMVGVGNIAQYQRANPATFNKGLIAVGVSLAAIPVIVTTYVIVLVALNGFGF